MTQDSTAQDTSPVSAAARPEVHPWVRDAQQRPRFAIVGTFLLEWAQVRDFAVRAEELGFDAYWANDHPLRSMDCWTQLAALATVTTRLPLIALVSCVYYRSPALIARQAADVDRISGGRLVLGLGTGDDAAEFGQLGLRFPAAPSGWRRWPRRPGLSAVCGPGPVTQRRSAFPGHGRPGPARSRAAARGAGADRRGRRAHHPAAGGEVCRRVQLRAA